MRRSLFALPMLSALLVTAPAQAQSTEAGQLNVICSVQAEWCNMIDTVYAKTHGYEDQYFDERLGRSAGAVDC